MYPQRIRYLRPSGHAEVLAVLAQLGNDARVLAGGASLIPQLKYRQVSPAPSVLLDISQLDGLSGVSRTDSEIVVGSTTRHADAGDDAVLAAAFPGARDVARSIGDQQVRNMGTVGGGLVAVEPTGDWGPFLIAAGGRVRVASQQGQREIVAGQLFAGPLRSTVRPEELLTEVVVPVPVGRVGSAHAKLLVRAVTSLGSCSVVLTLDAQDRIASLGVGIGGLTPAPVAVPEVSEILLGQQLTDEAVREAKDELMRAVPTHSDAKTSAVHRRAIAGSLFSRAAKSAHARAMGAQVASTTSGGLS